MIFEVKSFEVGGKSSPINIRYRVRHKKNLKTYAKQNRAKQSNPNLNVNKKTRTPNVFVLRAHALIESKDELVNFDAFSGSGIYLRMC